jgi:RimJ/RimL family protein N-acetyltransferase
MPLLQPVPPLETDRLQLRPLTPDDLETAHQTLDLDLCWGGHLTREHRLIMIQFHRDITCRLFGGIYGDRAIALKASQEVIGLCGFRPWLCAQAERALFDPERIRIEPEGYRLEMGVGCGVASGHRRQGYAGQALRALFDYAFREWRMGRLFGMTGRANTLSMRLMRSVGMKVVENPDLEVDFPGAVGLIENPAA